MYASGEGGSAEQAAGDGLRDTDGVGVVAEMIEDDGIKDVEQCGYAASEEDRFEERW